MYLFVYSIVLKLNDFPVTRKVTLMLPKSRGLNRMPVKKTCQYKEKIVFKIAGHVVKRTPLRSSSYLPKGPYAQR